MFHQRLVHEAASWRLVEQQHGTSLPADGPGVNLPVRCIHDATANRHPDSKAFPGQLTPRTAVGRHTDLALERELHRREVAIVQKSYRIENMIFRNVPKIESYTFRIVDYAVGGNCGAEARIDTADTIRR